MSSTYVILIESKQTTAIALQTCLRPRGYEVLWAHGIHEALELLDFLTKDAIIVEAFLMSTTAEQMPIFFNEYQSDKLTIPIVVIDQSDRPEIPYHNYPLVYAALKLRFDQIDQLVSTLKKALLSSI